TIKELFEASQRRSGSPKITRELTKRGWRVSKNRVPRRMRLPGLRSIARRRFRVTTNSKHRYPVAPDRLQRNFTAQRPNQVWVSDITYLRVGCGRIPRDLSSMHAPPSSNSGCQWLAVWRRYH
ncbi:MAG: IS3 family transposase, partial [Candidatus Latescibacterota bacterium]|nr:IS3 family transposase [Candidatus Latescibacterota bacterium]